LVNWTEFEFSWLGLFLADNCEFFLNFGDDGLVVKNSDFFVETVDVELDLLGRFVLSFE
jgi:hypothetical protein